MPSLVRNLESVLHSVTQREGDGVPEWRYPIRDWEWTDHADQRCWEHGLDQLDVETVFQDRAAHEIHPNPRAEADETGVMIGRTHSGKTVTLIVTEPDPRGKTRIVTLRDSNEHERGLYRRKRRGS
jgi:uncharacterized DUF497 family protein